MWLLLVLLRTGSLGRVQGVPSIWTLRGGGQDAWPLQTADMTELQRIDARLVVTVSKAFIRESHTSHLSVI